MAEAEVVSDNIALVGNAAAVLLLLLRCTAIPGRTPFTRCDLLSLEKFGSAGAVAVICSDTKTPGVDVSGMLLALVCIADGFVGVEVAIDDNGSTASEVTGGVTEVNRDSKSAAWDTLVE